MRRSQLLLIERDPLAQRVCALIPSVEFDGGEEDRAAYPAALARLLGEDPRSVASRLEMLFRIGAVRGDLTLDPQVDKLLESLVARDLGLWTTLGKSRKRGDSQKESVADEGGGT